MNEIELCLNCDKPMCNNCLRYKLDPKKVTRIAQLDPNTREIIKIHSNFKAAADAAFVSERTMRRAVGPSGKKTGGFFWKKIEVEVDDV